MNNNFTKYINNIRDIFKEEVQEPFFYDIKVVSGDASHKKMFESIKDLFIAGLIMLKNKSNYILENYYEREVVNNIDDDNDDNDNNNDDDNDNDDDDYIEDLNNSININDITIDDINLISEYMLSIGIKTIFETYNYFKYM